MEDQKAEDGVQVDVNDIINDLGQQIAQQSVDLAIARRGSALWQKRALDAEAALASMSAPAIPAPTTGEVAPGDSTT